MGSLTGKTAIVTGASRGIGRAIAMRLAKDGAKTVLCARDVAALEDGVKEIKAAGGTATSIALDLRLPESPAELADFAAKRFDGIDIVVNNAGATKRGVFLELTDDDWADGFALKFFGAVRLTRAAWPYLKASRGSVVNISGGGGRTPGAEFAIGGSVNAAMQSLLGDGGGGDRRRRAGERHQPGVGTHRTISEASGGGGGGAGRGSGYGGAWDDCGFEDYAGWRTGRHCGVGGVYRGGRRGGSCKGR